ncbi:MAG: molybdopterin-dependent oxidoreductase [Chloroflexi bacterium]|nr:molybdopterin-dependent oxidoreductase [Chloroflexota bacterium]
MSLIGERFPRIDAWEKVTGKAQYTADLTMPGALHGKLLRSRFPHARILHLDPSEAEKLPGVKAVVTSQDCPPLMVGPFIEDEHVLATGKVRFVGEEVAAVAAVDEDVAEEALSLIRVEYEELPAVFDPQEAMNPDAPRIHEVDRNIAYSCAIARGDVAQGFQEADIILEDQFATPSVHQGHLEPLKAVAIFDASGRLTMWSCTKQPFLVRRGLARILNLPEGKIRVIQPYVSGGFGAKGHSPLYAICALLARKAGMPVRLENTVEEELIAGRPRVPGIVRIKAGVKMDGRIVAKETRVVADNGAYTAEATIITDTMARRHESLYRFTNTRTEAFLAYTNNPPTGAYRGFGNPQGTFALESMMDMLSEALGMDPLEFRLKNATRTGDVTVHGWEIGSCGLSQCLEEAARKAGWQGKRISHQPNRGVGVAGMIHASGRRLTDSFCGSHALVKVDEDGTVILISGEGEVGQGAQTVYAMIVAEELGLSLEDVRVLPADTDVSPFGFGFFSDRGTILGGSAARLAAIDARRQIFELAAQMLEAKPDDLEIVNRRIAVRGSPHRGLSLDEVAKHAFVRRGGTVIVGKGSYDPPSQWDDPQTKYGNLSTSYTFAAQVAEVEVDPDTGEVTLLNFVAAHDLGRAINPMAAEGQIEGAIAQGIGYALTEKLHWQEGSTLNPRFLEFKTPLALGNPVPRITLIETHDPFGPFGAKGVAEPGLVPVAPAIANAIYDAVKVRVKDLPIIPQKIIAGMKGR